MPSIVKTNANLSGGGLALVDYSLESQSDNTLGLSVQFLCLPQFTQQNISQFRTGAAAPSVVTKNADVIALLRSLKAITLPTVRSCRAKTANGLTTIEIVLGVRVEPSVAQPTEEDLQSGLVPDGLPTNAFTQSDLSPAQQSAQSALINNFEITTATSFRSFSGSVFIVSTNSNYSFSFDYYAQEVTTEGTDLPTKAFVSDIFNLRAPGFLPIRSYITEQQIVTSRVYRNSLGVSKTQITSSAVYIQTKFEDD